MAKRQSILDGRPPRDPLGQLDRSVCRLLLKIIKQGRPRFDNATGLPVVDEAGNPVNTPASAADIKTAIDYLRLCGVHVGQQERDPITALLEQQREKQEEHADPAAERARRREKYPLPDHLREQAEAEKARQREERARLDRGLERTRNASIDEASQPIPIRRPGA